MNAGDTEFGRLLVELLLEELFFFLLLDAPPPPPPPVDELEEVEVLLLFPPLPPTDGSDGPPLATPKLEDPVGPPELFWFPEDATVLFAAEFEPVELAPELPLPPPPPPTLELFLFLRDLELERDVGSGTEFTKNQTFYDCQEK